MELTLNADQAAVVDAVGILLHRHAGARRLRDLGGAAPAYDHELHRHLSEAGFLDFVESTGSRLEAALVQELIAQQLGSVSTGYTLLVGASFAHDPQRVLAVAPVGVRGPLRFAADAHDVLVIDDREVRLVDVSRTEIRRTTSRLGWPAGEIGELPAGVAIDGLDPQEARSWLRVAHAVELVGAMSSAVDLTVRHVTERMQFGRPVGSFQAVQHGLAECAILVEGSRLLALEAAWNADPGASALALTHALEAAARVFPVVHQYSGAIGFTEEYDLHLSTMRLPALRAEALSFGRPAHVAVDHVWQGQ